MGTEIGWFHHVDKAGVDYVFVDHPSFPRPGGACLFWSWHQQRASPGWLLPPHLVISQAS